MNKRKSNIASTSCASTKWIFNREPTKIILNLLRYTLPALSGKQPSKDEQNFQATGFSIYRQGMSFHLCQHIRDIRNHSMNAPAHPFAWTMKLHHQFICIWSTFFWKWDELNDVNPPSASTARSPATKFESIGWAPSTRSISSTAILMAVFISAVRVSRYILNTAGSFAWISKVNHEQMFQYKHQVTSKHSEQCSQKQYP